VNGVDALVGLHKCNTRKLYCILVVVYVTLLGVRTTQATQFLADRT